MDYIFMHLKVFEFFYADRKNIKHTFRVHNKEQILIFEYRVTDFILGCQDDD